MAIEKPQTINIAAKLDRIHEHWKPHILAELNGQMVKLVKFRGDFVWHHHENEDEMFLVVRGSFEMHLRDPEERIEKVGAGEFIVIPRGVEHKPVANEECEVMLFEPGTTLNTGNTENELTLRELQRI